MFVRRAFREGNSVAVVIPSRFVEELVIEPGDLLGFDMMKDGCLRVRPVRVEVRKPGEDERKDEP